MIRRIVELAISGRNRIAACAVWRISCEGWLKVEILHSLAEIIERPDDIGPEEENVDLTVRRESEKVLIELKTFPTNYGRAGKPITNFIDSVIDDLRKLSAKRLPGQTGLAVWMAYPIPQDTPSQWTSHVARIEAHAKRTKQVVRIPLWGEQCANLYVMEGK